MTSARTKTKQQLLDENENLRLRLSEAEETLRAIQEGEVDAIVVSGSKGEQLFSLVGAESIYRLIVETMKEAAFTVTFDGTILFCNAQFGELVNTPLERIIGQPLRHFVATENAAAVDSLLIIAQQQPVRQRLVFEATGGKTIPAHISSNVLNQPDGVSICVVATDLTELENSTEMLQQLRLQQEALRESEARFRALFENSLDATFMTITDGQILAANPAACAMFGMTQDEICRVGRKGLADPDDPRHAITLAERKRTGRINKSELGYVRANGEKFVAEVDSVVLPGEPAHAFVILRDITERKQAEEALRQSAQELARSNKDLEQFAYVASHDLQEPLRMVSGFMGLLRDRCSGNLDEKAREYIQYSIDGAKRMQQMIDDLLQYSRVGSKGINRMTVDLNRVVEDVKLTLDSAIKESKAVVTVSPLPTVTADPMQMRQLLQNLISNAMKFHAKDRRPEVEILANRDSHNWLLQVKDNGIGISPENADRIFNIFQRLHGREEYSGSGIGLAICKKIVERHGGRIWVESQPMQGSTFFFTLPA